MGVTAWGSSSDVSGGNSEADTGTSLPVTDPHLKKMHIPEKDATHQHHIDPLAGPGTEGAWEGWDDDHDGIVNRDDSTPYGDKNQFYWDDNNNGTVNALDPTSPDYVKPAPNINWLGDSWTGQNHQGKPAALGKPDTSKTTMGTTGAETESKWAATGGTDHASGSKKATKVDSADLRAFATKLGELNKLLAPQVIAGLMNDVRTLPGPLPGAGDLQKRVNHSSSGAGGGGLADQYETAAFQMHEKVAELATRTMGAAQTYEAKDGTVKVKSSELAAMASDTANAAMQSANTIK